MKDILNKRFNIPFLDSLQKAIGSLNKIERLIFYFFILLMIVSVFAIFVNISHRLTVEVPRAGGKIVEGVIGSPRFLNPLLSISDTDRDLTSLMYSGLLKATPEGRLVNDLAESYEVSLDGLRYVVILKEGAKFHDGSPVTADDVVLTVNLAKSDILKSPRRASWDGIGVEKIDQRTIAFNLREPYSPFLENLSLGILPSHIWGELSPEEITFSNFNTEPVGSGPFELKGISRDSSGIPEAYKLKAFNNYTLGEPFIKEIEIKFYDNEEELVKAFEKKDVTSIHAISPEIAQGLKEDGRNVITSPLPRVFGVFFNQNQASVFTNKEVRSALNKALNRERIVSEVLNEFGTEVKGPLPAGLKIRREVTIEDESELPATEEALSILENAGWQRGDDGIMVKKNERLSFSISTSNAPELKAVAGILKEEWEKVGAAVELKFFDTGNLNQEVIRPRAYDALLFGEIVGRDFDLFAFWHSSQRNDPGLNIALYANITADSLLEEIRAITNLKEKESLYLEFEKEIEEDIPAVFLYSPDFIVANNKNIKGQKIGVVTTPAERFLNIHEWYLQTDRVWPFLTRN